jgi:hypothetical protein
MIGYHLIYILDTLYVVVEFRVVVLSNSHSSLHFVECVCVGLSGGMGVMGRTNQNGFYLVLQFLK